jgi:hypothetical protein
MSYSVVTEKTIHYYDVYGRMIVKESKVLAGHHDDMPKAMELLERDHRSSLVRYDRDDLERAKFMAKHRLYDAQKQLDEITEALQFFDSAEQLLEAQELGDSINEGKPSSKGGRL